MLFTVERSTTGWTQAYQMDEILDASVRNRTHQYQMDRIPDVAKVGVAGSNPVVRSRQSPRSEPISELPGGPWREGDSRVGLY